MNRNLFPALFFGFPAFAQDLSQCPAPVDLGAWGGQVTQSQARISVEDQGIAGVLVGPVDPSTDVADISGDPCAPGFIAEGVGPDGTVFTYEMEFVGWQKIPFDNMEFDRPRRENEKDAEYRERLAIKPMRTYPIYEGEWNGHPQMSIKLRMMFTATDSGVAQQDMRFTSGQAIGRAQPIIAMRALEPSDERYECRCRAKLDAWLDAKIDEAKMWQSAYGREAWRKRPADWPAKDKKENDAWNANAYNALVARAVENHVAGASLDAGYDAALPEIRARAAEGAYSGRGGVNKTNVYEAGSERVAETNPECQILTYDSHTTECFPDLSMDSTIRHERQHRKTCRDRGNAGPMSAEQLGADEVLAYGEEIKLLTGWAERNCKS